MPRLGSKKIKVLLSGCLEHPSCHYVIEGDNPMLLVVEDRAFSLLVMFATLIITNQPEYSCQNATTLTILRHQSGRFF